MTHSSHTTCFIEIEKVSQICVIKGFHQFNTAQDLQCIIQPCTFPSSHDTVSIDNQCFINVKRGLAKGNKKYMIKKPTEVLVPKRISLEFA